MSSELHKLYRSLEASVEEKTRDLHEAKRRLEVLYQCSQALNTSQIDVHCFRHILQIVRDNEAADYLELNVGDNWRISEGSKILLCRCRFYPSPCKRPCMANCTGKAVTNLPLNHCLTAFRQCWVAVCTLIRHRSISSSYC